MLTVRLFLPQVKKYLIESALSNTYGGGYFYTSLSLTDSMIILSPLNVMLIMNS